VVVSRSRVQSEQCDCLKDSALQATEWGGVSKKFNP